MEASALPRTRQQVQHPALAGRYPVTDGGPGDAKGEVMTRYRIAILAAAAALPMSLAAPPAAAQGVGTRFQYAVKIVCGRSPAVKSPVAQGNYFTAVNVHNPREPIEFRRKVAVALPGKGGPISAFINDKLEYDQAMEFDCAEILKQLEASHIPNAGFVKGFLVIMAQHQLDVVAVYTAAPLNTNQVSSIHTERVPPRDRNAEE